MRFPVNRLPMATLLLISLLSACKGGPNALDCEIAGEGAVKSGSRDPRVETSAVIRNDGARWVEESRLRVKRWADARGRTRAEESRELMDKVREVLPAEADEAVRALVFQGVALSAEPTAASATLPLLDLEQEKPIPGLSADLPFEVLHWSGNPRYRLNLVILGDGFTERELPEFRKHARALADELFESPANAAFGDYRDLINVFRVDVASEESGADCDDGKATFRKTRYGTLFPVACTNALLGRKDSDRFIFPARQDRVIGDANRIRYDGVSVSDEVVLISNTAKYGGGGNGAAATLTVRPTWAVAAHELGHTWGQLGDEYYYAGDACTPLKAVSANLSLKKDSIAEVKWSRWIEAGTPIPTPKEETGIGLYAGAGGGCKDSMYRPSNSCKMIDSDKPFCPVCHEQMIRRLYDRAGLIEGDIREEDASLTADVARPDRVRARWSVDGVVVQDTPEFRPLVDFKKHLKGGGSHEIRLVVFDEQAPVRKDRCDAVFARKHTVR